MKLCGESRDGLRDYLTTLSPMTLPQNLPWYEDNRQGIPAVLTVQLSMLLCLAIVMRRIFLASTVVSIMVV